MVTKPSVLLADEPTGNLDSQTAESVTQLMLDVVNENESTLILITHDRRLAETCCDRIVELLDGRLLEPQNSSNHGSV